MKTSKQPTGDRRKFLLGATLGSAGAVAAVVTGGKLQGVLEVTPVGSDKKVKGYHETDHIRQYYETTRF